MNRIPTALPDEPTTSVGIWERIDEETVRVRVSGPETVRLPAFTDDDSSDGIPLPLEAEHSSTVSIAIVDISVAFEAILALARRDRVAIDILPLRRDARTARIETVDVLAMTGDERVPLQAKVLALTVLDWRTFRDWFPRAIREAEVALFRTLDTRKATALILRLKAFARQVATHKPPKGANHDVLHLE